MFTGLIQHCGEVAAADSADAGMRLLVRIDGWSHTPALGESIAVNGSCLTMAEISEHALRFDVIPQTLRVTTLGDLRPGDRVNLEHAATPTTMLGGHIVQGHIDGVGIVQRVIRDGSEHRLVIQPLDTTAAMRLIVDKGSIAVSGVSLTVASVAADRFEVALIPTTLALTNLGWLREGARINLEYDYIAKIVANWLERSRT
jgi:riboflavin synthase alpha subunit